VRTPNATATPAGRAPGCGSSKRDLKIK
jgi:hypothetical protein